MTDVERAIYRLAEEAIPFQAYGRGQNIYTITEDVRNTCLAALREKQEREKGCEYCKADADGYVTAIGTVFYLDENKLCVRGSKYKPREVNVCPMCGRKLTGGVK